MMNLFRILVVETIGSCNRTCASCARQTLQAPDGSLPLLRTVETKVGAGGHMPRPLFDKIVDEAAALNFKGSFRLNYYCEPLLDERIIDLAAHAKRRLPRQATIRFTTNADLMTREMARELNKIMGEMHISLYLPKERKEARTKELRSWLPRPRLVFTTGDHNLARGVDHPDKDRWVASVIDTPCFHEQDYIAIAYSGDVCHCCFDAAAEFNLGNANDSTLTELWESDAYASVVESLSQPGGRRQHAACLDCPRPGTGKHRSKVRVRVVPGGARP